MERLKAKIIRKTVCLLAICAILLGISNVAVFAQADGAYLTPANASYVNPETGSITDGGSNEALGTSMCQAIVDTEALVEVVDGETYVTVGLGLDSNISSVQMLVQTAARQDEYVEVAVVETGRYTKDNDDCVQYRFKVYDAQLLISPVLFVEPMGRAVQFFIQLDMEQSQAGTGNYLSEMVVAEPEETEAEVDIEEPQNSEEVVGEEVAAEEELPADEERALVERTNINLSDSEGIHVYEVETDETEDVAAKNSVPVIGIMIGVAVIILAGTVLVMRRRKGGK